MITIASKQEAQQMLSERDMRAVGVGLRDCCRCSTHNVISPHVVARYTILAVASIA